MKKISKPHDLFVKRSLKDVRIARDFLQAHLPVHIRKRIDFNSLKLTEKSFVSDKLSEIHSDIIYACKIDGQKGYIYTIIEHQSTPDKLMAFRKVQYTFALMEDHLRQGNKKLPIIVPLCIYNGTASPYPHSTDIYDCFDDVDLAKKVVFKPFKLVDLSVLTDKQIKRHGLAALMEKLLQHHAIKEHSRDVKALINYLLKSQLLPTTVTVVGENYLISVLEYVTEVSDTGSTKATESLLIELSRQLPEDQGKIVMNMAERLRQSGYKKGILAGKQAGIQEGKQEGIEEEKLAIARKMLLQGYDDKAIMMVTDLSQAELNRIRKSVGQWVSGSDNS